MTILLIGSVLFGAVLGRFFKFLIFFVPTCAFVLGAVLVNRLTSSTACCARFSNSPC